MSCARGVMIVLDVTVVNVALPSIQTDLVLHIELGLGGQRYLIAFGDFCCCRTIRRPGRSPQRFAGRVGHLHHGIDAVRALSESDDARARAFVQGAAGDDLGVILGMIVTMFRSPMISEGDRRLRVRRLRRWRGRPAGRWRDHPGDQLALDFLCQRPGWIATAVAIMRLLPRDQGIGISEGADIPGAVLITSALMLGVTRSSSRPPSTAGARAAPFAGRHLDLLLAIFLAREATAAKPLMPLRIFARATSPAPT